MVIAIVAFLFIVAPLADLGGQILIKRLIFRLVLRAPAATGFLQQLINAIQCPVPHPTVWTSPVLAHQQLESLLPLLQLHQTLGQGGDGLREIFRSTAIRNDTEELMDQDECWWITAHGWRCLKIKMWTAPQPMPPLATPTLYLLAGTAVGLLALLSGIPAAPLAGALLGAGLCTSGRLDNATWPTGTRTVLKSASAR